MGEIRELAGRRIGGRGGVVRDDSLYHVGGGAMKKYNTKPIDFTGCHPVIAEHLKRGEAIECRVWDSYKECPGSKFVKFVIRYRAGKACPYETYDNVYMHAEPITRKVRRIMPPERAIPVLIAEGWRFNTSGQMDGPGQIILPAMFCSMGRRFDGPNTIPWIWPPCIIEEVEDDE